MEEEDVWFLPEQEYAESFTSRGDAFPPFLVFVPYVVRDGVPGYLIPVSSSRVCHGTEECLSFPRGNTLSEVGSIEEMGE